MPVLLFFIGPTFYANLFMECPGLLVVAKGELWCVRIGFRGCTPNGFGLRMVLLLLPTPTELSSVRPLVLLPTPSSLSSSWSSSTGGGDGDSGNSIIGSVAAPLSSSVSSSTSTNRLQCRTIHNTNQSQHAQTEKVTKIKLIYGNKRTTSDAGNDGEGCYTYAEGCACAGMMAGIWFLPSGPVSMH